jgi:DNA-binding transcriptional regulator GbsR (MarR family)
LKTFKQLAQEQHDRVVLQPLNELIKALEDKPFDAKQQTIDSLNQQLEQSKNQNTSTNNDLNQAIQDAQSVKNYSDQAVANANANK